jgi:hypothetical protein
MVFPKGFPHSSIRDCLRGLRTGHRNRAATNWKKQGEELTGHKLVFSTLLYLLSNFVLAAASGGTAVPIDIPLGVREGFSATAIAPIGSGRYCVTGSVYEDAGPSDSALVLLVDVNSRQVVWRTRLPYGHDYVGNTATRCMGDGNAFYVITQERTNNSEALNQTRIVVNKISSKGKLLKQEPVKAGFDEWVYFLDVQPDAISIAGGTSATLDRGGKFGTFITKLDSNLVQTKIVKLDTGAFWTGTSARLDGQHLMVSGSFLPNKTSSSGDEAFAVSKIDLRSGTYIWSNYASPANTQEAASAFGPDGVIYVAALAGANLSVSVVDRGGKTVNGFSVKKPFCSIGALALEGRGLAAIGSSCSGGSSSVIVAIDLAGKTARVVNQLDNDMSVPIFDGHSLVGIVSTTAAGKVLRRSTQ